jgi:hypothetical protein
MVEPYESCDCLVGPKNLFRSCRIIVFGCHCYFHDVGQIASGQFQCNSDRPEARRVSLPQTKELEP